MKIYLAGLSLGNIDKKTKMNLYLAGIQSRPYVIKNENKIYVLESFYYMKDWMLPYIENHWHFLLDSGAFTFFGKTTAVNWKEYVLKYADFINKYNIDLFFELDLDNLIGIDKTRDLRKLLEDKTGKQSIPVWRPFRGIDYWYEMIEKYSYVAISASGQYDSAWTRKPNSLSVINKLIKEAHSNNSKVHGLGYTNFKGLLKLNWDSVDSTAWIYGNRGGYLYQFNGKTIIKIKRPENTKLKNRQAAVNNFIEWVKFQKYAERNL